MKLGISEKLSYHREMIIAIPDDMSIDEFDKLLDKAQSQADSSGDLPYVLERLNKNVKVTRSPDQDFSSPWNSDIEIDEFEELETQGDKTSN